MNLDGGSRPAGKQCVDATTDQAMMKAGTDMGASMGMNCKKMESKKEGEKFIVETDCMMKNVHMVSSTVFEGDFNSEYTSTMSAKYDPPFMGQSDMNVVTKAKYEGACQAGQIPGDIILPNGMKINVNEMGKKK